MLVVFGTGAATLLVITTVAGRSLSIDSTTLYLAAMTALFGTIGHTIVAWAHRYVPAAVSSLFILSQPALIAVLAWVAFDERLVLLHIVGGDDRPPQPRPHRDEHDRRRAAPHTARRAPRRPRRGGHGLIRCRRSRS